MKSLFSKAALRQLAARLAAGAWLALATPGQAFDFALAGPEFQVHTTTVGAQTTPDVAMDAAGNAIVVWFSSGPNLATSGGFAQRFNGSGIPLGSEFQFADSSSASGSGMSVAMAPDGRFVVVYNNLQDIIAKRYDAAGNELTPPAGVPVEVGNAFYVRSGAPLAASGPSRFKPRAAMDADANFVITWEDRAGQDGDAFGIFAKRYDAAGNELAPPPGVQGAGIGNEFQVNAFTGNRQMTPEVAMNTSGDFIITWWSFLQDGGFDAVMAKRYDAAGHERVPAAGTQGAGAGNEFQANAFKQEWAPLSPGGAGLPPRVAMNGDGSFVITWDGSPGGGGMFGSQDCSSSGVFAKRYDPSGAELSPAPGVQGNGIGNEIQVNSRGPGSQGPHDVAMSPDGHLVVSWYGSAGQPTSRVLAKVYAPSGEIVTPPTGSQGNGLCNEFEATTFTAEGFPAVAIAPGGNFIIVWDDSTGADGDDTGIFARRFVSVAGPTPISPLSNQPVLECPPEITVDVDGLGQAVVPDLRSQAVITGVCAPCASVTLTQSPAPGTVVTCGAHPITLTLSDTAGHAASCTTQFNVVNPAGAVNVVLKVVDQHGQEIPGSQIWVQSQSVPTGGSVMLSEGLYDFTVVPGTFGTSHHGWLSRTESAAVTCGATQVAFEWVTSVVGLRLQDQLGDQIDGSRFTLPPFGMNVYTGGTVTLPITDESVYPTLVGAYANGYDFDLEPFGHPAHLVRREAGNEVTSATTQFVFEWIRSEVAFRMQDQTGVEIAGARFTISPFGINVLTGGTVILPITDESVYPSLGGGSAGGYALDLEPFGHPAHLVRREVGNEVTSATTQFVFEWIRSEVAFRMQDQTGVEIAGARFTISPLGINVLTGGSVILPITDESVYPSLGGGSAGGYALDLEPFGHPVYLVRREAGNEVTPTTTQFVLEWSRLSCPLELRGSNGQPVAGSTFVLPPGFGPVPIGAAPAFPLNDLSVYPNASGLFTGGYGLTISPGDIAPTSSTIYLAVLASGQFSPVSFGIGGNTYSLACNSCTTDTTPPTITCASDVVIVSDRAACGEHDHDDDDWEQHRREGRQRDEHEDHQACRSSHDHDDHDAHGYTCRFWNRCVATGVTLTSPTVTDNCSVASVTHDHPSTTYPLGETRVTWTATDAAGNTSTCVQKVTVVPSVEISFRAPLVRKPTCNTIRRGQVVPFKVELEDCLGRIVRQSVTVKLQVQGIDSTTGDVFQDVMEDANGLGTDGTITSDGLMQYRNSQWQFNLDTGNFGDPNTVAGSRFYRATVTVVDNATLAVLGLGTVKLETGRR